MKKLLPYLREVTWTTVRSLGSVKYFQFSYFVIVGVPLLAEIYSANRDMPVLGAIFQNLPLNLKLLFVASLFYGLGIAFYHLFCPRIVKAYGNATEFAKQEFEFYLRAWRGERVDIVLNHFSENEFRAHTEIRNLQKRERAHVLRIHISSEEEGTLEAYYPVCVQRALLEVYGREKIVNRWAVFISLISYLLGTVILLYLLVVKTVEVIRA